MAAGDQYRKIEPSDQLIFDDENNLVGIRSGKSDSAEMRGLSEAEAASVQALVSDVGTITAAELLTTAGTTGQVVRVSDGDDKGAVLIWSTPAGATAETWCWWLWPQSPYL